MSGFIPHNRQFVLVEDDREEDLPCCDRMVC